LLVALWVLPLVARPVAELTAVSLAPVVLLAALSLVLHRAGIVQAIAGLFAQRALLRSQQVARAPTDRQRH
jgi:hypothetical protein